MYAVAISPLIRHLQDEEAKQVWFADDATAGGELTRLRKWWDRIVELGPDYGYYPNASKTWLIVKESKLEEASTIFQETGVAITMEGKRHLGAALGKHAFVESYVQQKVTEWVSEVERLSTFATTKPQAAYAALTMVSSANGPTWPGEFQILETYSDHWRRCHPQCSPTSHHRPECLQ